MMESYTLSSYYRGAAKTKEGGQMRSWFERFRFSRVTQPPEPEGVEMLENVEIVGDKIVPHPTRTVTTTASPTPTVINPYELYQKEEKFRRARDNQHKP
jgi:hypothetical protein